MQAQTRQRLIAAEPSMAKKMGRRLVVDTASSIGADSRLDDQVSIAKSELGTGVIIARNTTVTESKLGQFVQVGIDSLLDRVNVGDYTYLGRNAWLADTTIGKYCSIAQNLSCGTGNHPLHMISTSPMFYRNYGISFSNAEIFNGHLATAIGHDVWIGANVFIKSGITIGDGAVIAAGAVVTQHVLPYTIVGGVPARVIKSRFSQQDIVMLENLAWWNWPVEKLKAATPIMQTGNIKSLYTWAEENDVILKK